MCCWDDTTQWVSSPVQSAQPLQAFSCVPVSVLSLELKNILPGTWANVVSYVSAHTKIIPHLISLSFSVT